MFKEYKKFKKIEEAEMLTKLLEEHQVDYELKKMPKLRIEEDEFPIVVQLHSNQIRKVDKLLLAEEERQSTFEVIENFDKKEQARDLIGLLEQHNIPYKTGETGSVIDTTHTNSPTLNKTYVMIQTRHFKKVNALQTDLAKELVQNLGEEYHLYKLDNQELLDILEHQDEWHVNDVLMAQRILAERGIHYSEEDIELMKKRRWIDLRQAKAADPQKLMIAYVLAVLGGFLGLFMGWHYAYDRGYDPDGRSFYTFDAETRAQGIRILQISAIALVVWVGAYIIF